jgi:hypothetical protein
MTPKLLLAALAALAIAVGFVLPGPHRDAAEAQSQIPLQVIGES